MKWKINIWMTNNLVTLTSLPDKVEAEKKYSLAACITRFSAFSVEKETALVVLACAVGMTFLSDFKNWDVL